MQFEGVIETCAVVRHIVYAKRRDWAEGSSSMEFQDKVLKCIDCGADFVFTAGEQLFFHDKAFRNEPKRCKDRSSAASASSNGGRQLRPDSIFAIKGRASSPSNFRNSQDGRFSSLSSRLPD